MYSGGYESLPKLIDTEFAVALSTVLSERKELHFRFRSRVNVKRDLALEMDLLSKYTNEAVWQARLKNPDYASFLETIDLYEIVYGDSTPELRLTNEPTIDTVEPTRSTQSVNQ